MLEQLQHSSAVIEGGTRRQNVLLPKLPTICELSDQMGTSTCPGFPSLFSRKFLIPLIRRDKSVVLRDQLNPSRYTPCGLDQHRSTEAS